MCSMCFTAFQCGRSCDIVKIRSIAGNDPLTARDCTGMDSGGAPGIGLPAGIRVIGVWFSAAAYFLVERMSTAVPESGEVSRRPDTLSGLNPMRCDKLSRSRGAGYTSQIISSVTSRCR
jgi:hypothetical protein